MVKAVVSRKRCKIETQNRNCQTFRQMTCSWNWKLSNPAAVQRQLTSPRRIHSVDDVNNVYLLTAMAVDVLSMSVLATTCHGFSLSDYKA